MTKTPLTISGPYSTVFDADKNVHTIFSLVDGINALAAENEASRQSAQTSALGLRVATSTLKMAEKRIDELQGGHLDLIAENEKLKSENETLRQETEIWAQEARTQKTTVHECYTAATGGKGEPGDWNGAKPVKKLATRKEHWKNEALSITRLNEKIAVALEDERKTIKQLKEENEKLAARVAELEAQAQC